MVGRLVGQLGVWPRAFLGRGEVPNVTHSGHCQLHVSLACFYVCAQGSSIAAYPDYSRLPVEKRHLRACVPVFLYALRGDTRTQVTSQRGSGAPGNTRCASLL